MSENKRMPGEPEDKMQAPETAEEKREGADVAAESGAGTPGKQSGKALFFEIVRFLIVGGTATVVDYALAYLFYCWLLPPSAIGATPSLILSTAVGFCAGLVVNWVLSVLFVFRDVKDKKKSRSGKSFAVFSLIGVIGLAITELGMHFGVSLLPEIVLFGSPSFLSASWTWWIAKVSMTCIVLVWNYVGRKLFVFR